jgi:hypothetical protein
MSEENLSDILGLNDVATAVVESPNQTSEPVKETTEQISRRKQGQIEADRRRQEAEEKRFEVFAEKLLSRVLPAQKPEPQRQVSALEAAPQEWRDEYSELGKGLDPVLNQLERNVTSGFEGRLSQSEQRLNDEIGTLKRMVANSSVQSKYDGNPDFEDFLEEIDPIGGMPLRVMLDYHANNNPQAYATAKAAVVNRYERLKGNSGGATLSDMSSPVSEVKARTEPAQATSNPKWTLDGINKLLENEKRKGPEANVKVVDSLSKIAAMFRQGKTSAEVEALVRAEIGR